MLDSDLDPSLAISEYFDIPETYAKVYFQLLKSGSGTIGQVLTKELNINRQQLYNILDKLVALDMVTIVSQSKRGNIYLANSIETTTKNKIHKLENKLASKIESKEQFINGINHLLHLEDSPSLHDVSFQGRIIPKDKLGENVSNYINETIHTFKIAVKDFSTGMMPIVQPAIQKAINRDTTVIHLLFDKKNLQGTFKDRFLNNSWFSSDAIQQLIKNKRLIIKYTEHLSQTFFLFDDIIFVLVFSGIEDVDFSIVTKVDQITRRFKHKFEELFKSGTSLIT